MKSKLAHIRELYAAGDKLGALRIAAKFGQLGDEKEAITSGWSAYLRPEFYREIGQEPDALVAAGIAAMESKYGLSR